MNLEIYFYTLVIFIIINIILSIIGLVYVISHPHPHIITYYVIYLILLYLLVAKIKYPTKIVNSLGHYINEQFPNNNETPIEIIQEGTYIKLYKHPHNNRRVIKKIKDIEEIPLLGDGDEGVANNKCYGGSCGKGWIISNLGNCKDGYCNLLQYIMWITTVGAIVKNNKNRLKIQEGCPMITTINNISSDKLTWTEDRVITDHPILQPLFIDKNPIYYRQMEKFNNYLKKYDLYCMDCHLYNFGIDTHNNIKNFDGEIVDNLGKNICIFIYHRLRRFEMSPYDNFDRIYFTNEPSNIRGEMRQPVSKWTSKHNI